LNHSLLLSKRGKKKGIAREIAPRVHRGGWERGGGPILSFRIESGIGRKKNFQKKAGIIEAPIARPEKSVPRLGLKKAVTKKRSPAEGRKSSDSKLLDQEKAAGL